MGLKKIKEELEKRLKEKEFLEKKVKKKVSKKSDKAISELNSKIDFLNKKLNELLFVKKKEIKKIEKIESLFDKGIYVGIKRDGATCQVHFDNGKVKVWTEDGSDITENIPTIVNQFAKKKGSFVVIGELEWYHNGKHQPRADTSGIINRKGDEREKEVRITIYDELYSDEDIHKKPYSFRRELYSKITEDDNIKISDPEFLCKTEVQLRTAVKKCSEAPGSEGAMLKLATMGYPLKIHPNPPPMIKYKRESQLVAKVIKVDPVKGAKAWGYDCALKDAPYLGKTYNTSIQAEVGDHIIVSFVDISEYKDPKTGKIWFNFWAPHVIGKTDKPLSDKNDAHEIVLKTTGRIQERSIPKAGLSYHPETAKGFSKESPKHKDCANFEPSSSMCLLKKKKVDPNAPACPDFKPKGISMSKKRFVIQLHFRGSTCHADFRHQVEHYLKGFTLALQKDTLKKELDKHWKLEKKDGKVFLYWDGEIYYIWSKEKIEKKPSKELERKVYAFHRQLAINPNYWKVNLKTGEEKARTSPAGKAVEKIYCLQKTKEPYDWLDVKGVTDPRVIEPSPGGTRFYPGIFVEVDSGTYEMGADKSYFKEFFLNGRNWKGRYLFRMVSGLEETRRIADWLYWKPNEQEPYVLSRRAIREKWFPKEGSALPANLERKIPPILCYWRKNVSTEEKLKRREEVSKFLKEKGSDFSAGSRFILTRRFWKGQEVIRKSEVSDFHIKMGDLQLHLNKNPILSNAAGFAFKGNHEFFIPGKYSPNSKINPNKKIPAFVEYVDKGFFEILKEDGKNLQVKFSGNHLKGIYDFKTSDGQTYNVVKQSSEQVSHSKTISFGVSDFNKQTKTVLAKDIKFPYKFKTVAFSEGTWHNVFYPWSVIKEAAPKIIDASAVTFHVGVNDPILTEVGKVIGYELDEKNKRLIAECELFDTTAGKDVAILLANKRISDVSVRIDEDSTFGECTKINEWLHIAFVRDGEVTDAKICYNETCQ